MCIIRPYEELRKGNSHPTKSILLNYNSLPPQLVLWRALKSFHLAVGLISCMAALGSLLAIGLSALFINKVIELRTTEMMIRPYLDEFIHLNSSIITSPEQFYVGVSCMTARTSLPPWTDEHYLYVPFLPTKTGGPINLDSNALFEADTRAYGMDLECSDLQPDEFVVIEDSGDVSFYHMDLEVYPKSLQSPLQDANIQGCNNGWWLYPGVQHRNWVCPDDGKTTMEFIRPLKTQKSENGMECIDYFVAGWARHDGHDACGFLNWGRHDRWVWRNSSEKEQKKATLIGCRPILTSRNARLTVDSKGYVQGAKFYHQADSVSDHQLQNISSRLYGRAMDDFNNRIYQSLWFFPNVWHNDSVSTDWFNYFIRKDTAHGFSTPNSHHLPVKRPSRSFEQCIVN
jgi:hypothetical protein